MTKQKSGLEEEVSPIDALDVLIRIGSREDKGQHPLARDYAKEVYNILEYLSEECYIQIEEDAGVDDRNYFTTLTPKGRELYEKAKEIGEALFSGRFISIARLQKYRYDDVARSVKYENEQGVSVREDTDEIGED